MHRYVWKFYNGDIPKGYDIHHKDGNKLNNKIENLEILSHSEHTKLYASGYNQFTTKEMKEKNKIIRRNYA